MIQLVLFPLHRWGLLSFYGLLHDMSNGYPALFASRRSANRAKRKLPRWMKPECINIVAIDVHDGDYIPTLVVHNG